ncbi:MAG: hypothetical protein MJ059_06935 [Lachnospiraceae bacterium]|nr:hypothetical protein [Lachnospiraceae bacterium]
MRHIKISDTTLKHGDGTLTFKEKIEIAKLLDRLGTDVIEIEGITGGRADVLRIKSVAQAVKEATLAVPVSAFADDTVAVFDALKEAPGKRLQVVSPVSSVQMEYLFHKKPDVILKESAEKITECARLTDDVEFVAVDATRAERGFLCSVLQAALDAGAKTVTVCDTAGNMLPGEFREFIGYLYENVKGLSEATLGIDCADDIHMADACAADGVLSGAGELKARAFYDGGISLKNVASMLKTKSESFGAQTSIRTTEMKHIIDRISVICSSGKSSNSPFEDGVRDHEEAGMLNVHDSEEEIAKAVKNLGYELSDEDGMRVYETFLRIAERKESVSTKELEVIIASEAMQVPESYKLVSYMVTSGNKTEAVSHIKLSRDGVALDGISLGDGPIDSSFLAIEKIIGCHYELDDFQIQSITEGREAMGQTIVKLRSGGKLYSGRGISTDIIGSGIKAYINALNKIVYEEEQ